MSDEQLKLLARASHQLDERLNRAPNRHAPYVGESAFATKAGIHASAIVKDPATYEHITPETVGNRRKVLVSDQAGKSNVLAELERIGLKVNKDDPRIGRLLDVVKEREAIGYAYETADASFELLARRMLGTVPKFFDVTYFDVKVEQRGNGSGGETLTTAVVKVKVGDETLISAAEGNGPVNALDVALRKDLGKYQKYIEGLKLTDYRVRILNSGTEAVTRVLIESEDETGERWTTIGVSPNIIDASFQALMDSIVYKLVAGRRAGVRLGAMRIHTCCAPFRAGACCRGCGCRAGNRAPRPRPPSSTRVHRRGVQDARRGGARRRSGLWRGGGEGRPHHRLRPEPRRAQERLDRPRRARGDPRGAGAARPQRSFGLPALFEFAAVLGLRGRCIRREDRAHVSTAPMRRDAGATAGRIMIDHISIAVRDLEAGGRFYEAVLATLGYSKMIARADHHRLRQEVSGFLDQRCAPTWRRPIRTAACTSACARRTRRRSMRSMPRRCKAGGKSDGAPGPRPEYTPGYYAAFVRDPDGNRIEAVTFVDAKR